MKFTKKKWKRVCTRLSDDELEIRENLFQSLRERLGCTKDELTDSDITRVMYHSYVECFDTLIENAAKIILEHFPQENFQDPAAEDTT